MNVSETLEQEARRLRTAIYGPILDENWRDIRMNWIADIDWLRKRVALLNQHPEWTIANQTNTSL